MPTVGVLTCYLKVPTVGDLTCYLKVPPVGDHVRDGSGCEAPDAEGIVETGAYSWGLDLLPEGAYSWGLDLLPEGVSSWVPCMR